MNDSILKQIQKIEKEMLDAFVSICEKENLQYYLYAGTVFGAVRHSGFIPWDDDIDVCMPRKDYDKFISIANNYLKDEWNENHKIKKIQE